MRGVAFDGNSALCDLQTRGKLPGFSIRRRVESMASAFVWNQRDLHSALTL